MTIDTNSAPPTTLAQAVRATCYVAGSGDTAPSDARQCVLPSGLRAMLRRRGTSAMPRHASSTMADIRRVASARRRAMRSTRMRRAGANWPPDFFYKHPEDGARIIQSLCARPRRTSKRRALGLDL